MSVTSNIDKIRFDFNKLKKEIETNVLDRGLDKVLEKSKRTLAKKLFNIISEIKENRKFTAEDIEEGIVDIPKGEEEILKHLTGVNIQQFNKTKDFTTITDSEIVFAHKNQGTGAARRVRLRIPMNPGDSYQSQLNQAKTFFNKTIFAIPNEAGEMKYYVNPGIDLSKHVKVVCSTQRGDDQTSESEDRFNRVTSDKDYAEWSVFQNTIEEIIEKSFIDITPIINDIKKGDSEEAVIKLNREKKTQKIDELRERVTRIQNNQELEPGMEAYNNLTGLIRTLRITKKRTKTSVIYSLEADFNEPNELSQSAQGSVNLERQFFDRLKSAIAIWKLNNVDHWVNALVKEIVQTIKKFKF